MQSREHGPTHGPKPESRNVEHTDLSDRHSNRNHGERDRRLSWITGNGAAEATRHAGYGAGYAILALMGVIWTARLWSRAETSANTPPTTSITAGLLGETITVTERLMAETMAAGLAAGVSLAVAIRSLGGGSHETMTILGAWTSSMALIVWMVLRELRTKPSRTGPRSQSDEQETK